MGGTRSLDRADGSRRVRRERVTAPSARSARSAGHTHRIMLASTGTPIDPSVIDRTAQLVAELSADRPVQVVVISVARIWGTKLGLPNPGLYPHKGEWDEQRAIANEAAQELGRRGIEAKTKVVASRHAGKAVARWAASLGCRAIVVGAPEVTTWERWLRGDEPRSVARSTSIPVHAIQLPPEPRRRSGFGLARPS